MTRKALSALALLGSVALGPEVAVAQDSGPLIELLIRKGIITDQEAEELRAELVKDFAATTSAGRLNLSSNDSEFRLSGDIRARYESRTGQLPSGDHSERNRFRYRLRGGLTAKVIKDWTVGIRLETSSGNRSSNVTLGDDSGPWAKTSDGIYVGQVYAMWTPNPEFTFSVGRMPNPLVTTSMVWDGDINPEGLSEKFTRRIEDSEFSVTAGQFLYAAAGTQNAFGSTANLEDLLLLAWQGGFKQYLEGTTRFFQVNPTIYHYVQNGPANPTAFRGSFSSSNATAVNNLFLFEVPMEYDWVFNDTPMRAFADIAYNIDGADRARKWGRPDLDGEVLAYQVGLQYGKAANRGEWDARVFYQSVGAFALDPNLVDSDLFDSRTNMQGFVFNGNYALGPATQMTFTLARGEPKESSLVAPGSGDVGSSNALDEYWLVQLDLNVKY